MNKVSGKSRAIIGLGLWMVKRRRILFNIMTAFSSVLFLVCLWLCLSDAKDGLSWMTRGVMAVQYSASREHYFIVLRRADEPNEAQILAALPLLEATLQMKLQREWVAVEGWGDVYHHWDHGLYATELYHLSIEYQYVGSRLPAGPVIGSDRRVLIPLIEPLALFAILPVVWGSRAVWRWMNVRRPRPGFCNRCSYDLTGNVSGICPECGAAVEVQKQRA